jgi:hydroxymethylpyrimidine/phosphomethylpyrimidine kinase
VQEKKEAAARAAAAATAAAAPPAVVVEPVAVASAGLDAEKEERIRKLHERLAALKQLKK